MTFSVPAEAEGQRIDSWLASVGQPQINRSAAQRLCEQGMVTVDGRAVSKNHRLRGGEVVMTTLPDPVPDQAVPQEIPLDIVYEDDYLLVVNKPKGMVVHPAAGNPDGTLVNGLLSHCGGSLSGIGGVVRPGIVHRIDKDTSGLLIVAKCDQAHQGLARQIKAHTFTREYEAVVYGRMKQSDGTVNAPIGRHPQKRKQMCVTTTGNTREAVTHYHLITQYKGFAHLRLQLETGRTHQIRVHMAYIGHPVAGDIVYGPKKTITALGGQCLHAKTIGFEHPITGEYLEFTSQLPSYFTDFLSTLSFE